ncbi:Variant-specific surface protein [Giardia duodenalis]|uniref:Variant-specific surface protein n=1 Tax=Giardia intestinalis TaxID=5741 RepID=V6TRM9_GIAIN|nr:Variant-specific surface protein [Giardia intestinalis]
MCSGGFFLFMGGCYSQTGTLGSSICTAVSNGECTTCATANWLFTNPTNPLTNPGTKCLLCSDAIGDGTTKGVANCNTCTAPSGTGPATCSACQDGYYKAGDACTKCDTNCATCSGSGASACTSCPEGKYLKNSQCVETNQCTSDYYPDPVSGKCISCSDSNSGIENCDTCEYDSTKGKPKCLTCTDASTKTPRTSLDGTSTCVAKTLDGCQGTDKELFMKQDQTCALCAATGSGNDEGTANCKTCTKTQDGAKPVCDTCKEGYYLDSDASCKVCTGANCATCSKDDPTKCLTCKSGYFLQGGTSPGTCTPCDDADSGIPGCATCTFSTSLTCSSCKPNYKASNTKPNSVTCTRTCEDETACGGTAGSCDAIVINASGEMTYYCSLCGDSNQFPIDGICTDQQQQNTCAKGVCTSCTTGYFLYMGGCYSTTSVPGNLMCKTAEGGICTTPTGQYFKIPGATASQQSVLGCGNPLGTTVGGNAYVGIQDCKTCTAPSEASPAGMAAAKCTACNDNKALTGSGYGCVTCSITGCSTCKADNVCEACSDGYRLEGDTCVRTGGNLSTGAIAGISVAVIAVVGGLVGFLCWWFICRGKV